MYLDVLFEYQSTSRIYDYPLITPQIPPATRIYVLMLMVITTIDVSVGKVIDSGNTFSLDWGKTIKVSHKCSRV